MDVRDTINIGNICAGSVPEVFERTIGEVLKNIADINTPPKQKRQVVLKFTFEPSESREVGEVSFTCDAKLASVKPAKGNFFIARRGNDVRGYARDPKQEQLFASEPPATPKSQ